jgi:phosphate transport system substrate-binding protein
MKSMPSSSRLRIPAICAAVALAAFAVRARADAYHARPTPDVNQPTIDPSLEPYVPTGQYTGKLKATTSQTIEFTLRLWIKRFQEKQPGVTITFEPAGGEPTANGLTAGKIDFGMITREISPDGLQAFVRAHGYSPLAIPVCGGSIRLKSYSDVMVFIVNKDNPIDKITYSQLDAIFSGTHNRKYKIPVATWGDIGVGGEWADKIIHPWTIKPWDGFEEFIRQRVLAGGSFRDVIRQTDDGTRPLSAEVAADPYAISLDSLAWVGPGVKVLSLAVDDNGPFYAPTPENIFSWKYPLNRFIYAYIDREPGTPVANPILKEFLRFILSKDGQQCVVDDQLYFPLNAELAKKSRAKID